MFAIVIAVWIANYLQYFQGNSHYFYRIHMVATVCAFMLELCDLHAVSISARSKCLRINSRSFFLFLSTFDVATFMLDWTIMADKITK